MTIKQLEQTANVVAYLKAAQIPSNLWPIIVSQVIHETGYFTNTGSKYNNFSGIKYTKNSPYQSGKTSSGWATYANGTDWAKDLARILKFNGPAGRPYDASSMEDYVNKLKANNYFAEPAQEYYNGMVNAFNNIVSTISKLYDQQSSGGGGAPGLTGLSYVLDKLSSVFRVYGLVLKSSPQIMSQGASQAVKKTADKGVEVVKDAAKEAVKEVGWFMPVLAIVGIVVGAKLVRDILN